MVIVRRYITLVLLLCACAVDVPAQDACEQRARARSEMRRLNRQERKALAETQRARRDSLRKALDGRNVRRGKAGMVLADPARAYVVPLDTLVVMRTLSDTAAVSGGHVLADERERVRVQAHEKETECYYNKVTTKK